MNIWDIAILALIGIGLGFAAKSAFGKNKKDCGGCCSCCRESCAQQQKKG